MQSVSIITREPGEVYSAGVSNNRSLKKSHTWIMVSFKSLSITLLLLLSCFVTSSDAKVTAKASHILVKSKAKCMDIKKELEGGADFSMMAKKYSTCPSAKRGGDLGTFSPGQMVPAFNDVVFKEAINEVHGPIKTQFGYHLILTSERSE